MDKVTFARPRPEPAERLTPGTHILIIGGAPFLRERARSSLRMRDFIPVMQENELDAAKWIAANMKKVSGQLATLIGGLVLMDGLSWQEQDGLDSESAFLADIVRARKLLLPGMFAVAFQANGPRPDNPFEPAQLLSFYALPDIDHLGERFERAIGKQIVQ